MIVLSIDLASGTYRDNGLVVLRRHAEETVIAPIDLEGAGLRGRPQAPVLAAFLAELAEELGATAIGLDGPQAWKSATNGHLHARDCEVRLHTQGKTGLPGNCKPRNYLGFIAFCIDTFDALDTLGWPRLTAPAALGPRVAVETFPTSAWRGLRLPPLPGKSKSREADVTVWSERLTGFPGVNIAGSLNHDQLQGAIAGLGVLALAEERPDRYEATGVAPLREEGGWREGFIVNPTRQANGSVTTFGG